MMARTLREHRAFAIVLIAFIVLGGAFSIATPLFEAPDEQWHFAFVQYVAQGRELPVQKPGQADHLARQEASQPPLYYVIAAAATFWIDTSDFPRIAWENPHYGFSIPGIVNDNKNLFIHTSQENFPWHNTALAVHLARFVSLLFGALAVLFTYLLGLEIFSLPSLVQRGREEVGVAAASAAFVAFVPQLLFLNGAVSNDTTIVAMCAFALWVMVRYVTLAPNASAGVASEAKQSANSDREIVSSPNASWLLAMTLPLSIAAGVAALAKVSGLGIFFLGAITILYVERKNFRQLALRFTLYVLFFLPVAGWWYARNYFLYGELTGTEMMLSIFGARVTPLTAAQFIAQVGEVWETFWVGYGWGNVRAPEFVYAMFGLLVGLGALGWISELWKGIYARRHGRERPSTLPKEKFLLLALWITVTLAAFLRWMLVTQAPHGRLLFPALPALALLVVFGLTRLFPRFRVAFALPFVLFAFPVLAFFAILRPAYAFPPALLESDAAKIANRVDIAYDGKMKLLGYDVSTRRVSPDSSLTVTLYWQALKEMDEDYSINISLLDANRRVLSQRNSYPGHGTLPTRLWRAGQMIQDPYWVPVPANAPAPSVAQIQVSLFRRETQKDLPAFDPNGNTITPTVTRIKVGSAQPVEARPQNQLDYAFGGSAQLFGYGLNRDELVLYWKRIAPMQNDYTVFVHWLDAGGKIIAQKDAEPSLPTSLWDDGEVIVERYVIARGAVRARVGLYRADTGERLRVGNDDSIILGVGQ